MHPDTPTYLETLDAIRDRCHAVLALARAKGATSSFAFDASRLPAVADFVTSLIRRDYPDVTKVPPHSRWRHYQMDGIDRVQKLVDTWTKAGVAKQEQARRVLDLFIVSVLLDAGAGNDWKYAEKATGKTYARSEGLAVAALDMFASGAFSSDAGNPFQCDAQGLQKLTVDDLAKGFQVSATNPLVGLEGRRNLLASLGHLIDSSPYFRGASSARPGNIADYLLSHATPTSHVDLTHLWTAIQSLKPIWPARISLDGVALGDVWQCPLLPTGSSLVPFHKLSQWLTYSLMEPLESILGLRVDGKTKLTGLAEYRNGGLFMDMGVLTLTPAALQRATMSGGDESVPLFVPADPAVVEWRALTVALMDEVGKLVRERLGMSEDQLELAKVLEGGTWKAGREVAAEKRPKTKGPPMNLISDGTVF